MGRGWIPDLVRDDKCLDPGSGPGMTGRRDGYRSARAVLQRGHGGVFLGSWREVAGMTVRKRTILVVVCGFGALRYMFFVTCPAGDWSLWEPTPVGDCL
jgi:hypothetical protein